MAERPPPFDPRTPESPPLTPREHEVPIRVASGMTTNGHGKWMVLRILVWSPLLLAVFMFFVTPTYFRPMLENFIGLVLLAILVGTLCVGFGLAETAIWLFRKGRVIIAVVVLVVYSITWLLAFSIVLLGPASLILICAPGTSHVSTSSCPNGSP